MGTRLVLALALLASLTLAQDRDSWMAGLQGAPGLGPGTSSKVDPNHRVLFGNVRIFDGKTNGLSEPRWVLVVGNKIAKISANPLDVANGAITIHGGGRTLMPGMIDGHTHLAISGNFGDIKRFSLSYYG